MWRTFVQSSNLHSVGYDPLFGVLQIRFHHGGVYNYFGVPQRVFEGLLAAPSKGQFHHRFIRKSFRYQRIA